MNRKHPPITRHLVSRWLLACAAWLLGGVAAPALATTISAGYGQSCSVTDAGASLCWGYLPEETGIAGAVDIRVGNGFSCALLRDGRVLCRGQQNAFGQLGVGFYGGGQQNINPVTWRQADGFSHPVRARQVATGERHACALTLDGEVYCWGDAGQGQLGLLQPTLSMSSDARPVAGLSGAVRIAAGDGSTCAVLQPGSVWCVGAGRLLGDGASDDPRTPRQVPGITDAVDVALFEGHACVLRAGGQVACWGRNAYGELGVPASAGTRTSPVAVTALPGAAKAIAVGYGYSCAVLVDGAIWCWGDHAGGQLGAGYLANSATTGFAQVLGITDAVAISAGQQHACAVLDGGYVQCWGRAPGLGNGLCNTLGTYYPTFPRFGYPIFNNAGCLNSSAPVPFAVRGLGPEADTGLVMNWAERTLPQVFPLPRGQYNGLTGDFVPRYYPRAATYLAVNHHGTPYLMYMGPDSGGQLLNLGRLATWAREARK